jgi:hypothetical protein
VEDQSADLRAQLAERETTVRRAFETVSGGSNRRKVEVVRGLDAGVVPHFRRIKRAKQVRSQVPPARTGSGPGGDAPVEALCRRATRRSPSLLVGRLQDADGVEVERAAALDQEVDPLQFLRSEAEAERLFVPNTVNGYVPALLFEGERL